SLGRGRGEVEAVEVVDMHEQIAARSDRLRRQACTVVAVVPGEGNRRLFESLGAVAVGDPGEVDAAAETIVLSEVVGTDSIPVGLSAMVAFDPTRSAAENVEAMRAAAATVVAGSVAEHDGRWSGEVGGKLVATGTSFE